MPVNPFKPTAGASPPLLVGRDEVLADFRESLADGPGAPSRLSIFTGARGVGKTVMLTEVGDVALQDGWVTLSETATPGLVSRLTASAVDHLHDLAPGTAPTRTVTGITLPVVGGGVTISPPHVPAAEWRRDVGKLLDVLERNGTGLLITVDEVHRGAMADLRDLAATYQHLVREDRNVALVLAGLPSAVSDLLSDDVLTFLRRADQVVLDGVDLDEVATAFEETIEANGRTITAEALHAATVATSGYPFMIQLVGYHVWRKANGDVIDQAAVAEGVPAARKRLGSTVHATALADLSGIDRTYLLAMAQDDGPSRTGEVARRMDESPYYAGQYRLRLIDAGIIEATGHGYVDFAIPYLREYLRDHAARYEMASRTRRSQRNQVDPA